MDDRLTFEQRSGGYWVAEDDLFGAKVEGGASYRIAMRKEGLTLRPEYELRFAERRPTLSGKVLPQEKPVSTHRSLERAIERANRHYRDRAKRTPAPRADWTPTEREDEQ